MTRDRLTVIARVVTQMKQAFKEGKDWRAWEVYEPLGDRPIDEPGVLEEILYIDNQLDARERNILKTYRKARDDGFGRSNGEGA